MAHWAEIDEDNKVTRVIVGNNEYSNEGYDWIVENLGGRWIKTSYNTRRGVYYNPETGEPDSDQSKALRKNYASVGMIYDESMDAFIYEQPFPSWSLDEETGTWFAPVPYPEDGNDYTWNEETQSWDLLVTES